MVMRVSAMSTAFLSLVSSSLRIVLSSVLKSQNQTVFILPTGRVSVSSSSSLYSKINHFDSVAMPEQNPSYPVDPMYPGTAVDRLHNVHRRVAELVQNDVLNGPWEDVRRHILWAGGLRDLPDAQPGQGYTGHSFNDWNHVDLTCMAESITDNENDGRVKGIARGNQLGDGIRIASIPELGPGGSWSTCALGCAKDPPQDVAHIQFRARIAFKLVWVPNEFFDTFVLVDDSGKLLAKGKPSEGIPPLQEREMNYNIVVGSKYAREADRIARNIAAE